MGYSAAGTFCPEPHTGAVAVATALAYDSRRVALQESSEYETDSEEDEAYGRQLLKPQFVPKAEREVRLSPAGVMCCTTSGTMGNAHQWNAE